MAMMKLEPTTTQPEHEGDVTVATEPKSDPVASNASEAQEPKTEPMTNEISSESLTAAETPAVAVDVRDVGLSDAPSVAATPPDDFDDEFLTVASKPSPLVAGPEIQPAGSPMFSATAGDHAPLDGVSVCDPIS